MLEDCENNWGKRTHYKGDRVTLLRIKLIRKAYQQYKDAIDPSEEERLLNKFLGLYVQNIGRLWD